MDGGAAAVAPYRLIGDDQLDHRQGVEHGDGGDVPDGEGHFKGVVSCFFSTFPFALDC